ncbi:MAG: hypothetical protein ACE5IY_20315 [bacterium]
MDTLSLNDVESGMELARPVTDLQGFTLAKAGTVLTEKHIKAFKAWGVTEVSVRRYDTGGAVNGTDKPAPTGELRREEQLAVEIDFLFQKNDAENPVIRELRRLAIESGMNAQGQLHGRPQRPGS